MPDESLWRCPECGRGVANRKHTNTGAALHDHHQHRAGRAPLVRALFDRVADAVRAIGPVIILPEKTRIAFQVRMSFAQVTPRKRWLDGHVVLARRLEHPRFRKIETFSPRNHVHVFRLERLADVDRTFVAWMREAYAVGEQRHLDRNA